MIIFGDIGGCYNSLMKLIEKIPKGKDLLFLGDLNDRGPDSRKVIEWVMANAKDCLHSNHGQMMTDYFLDTNLYEEGIWDQNGGRHTIKNYKSETPTSFFHREKMWNESDGEYQLQKTYYDPILKEHIEWLNARLLIYEDDKIFVSHAPFHPYAENPYDITNPRTMDYNLLWNRNPSLPREDGKLSIWGHNGQYEKFHTELGDLHGVCIDDSRNGNLCAYDTEEDKLYFQEIME